MKVLVWGLGYVGTVTAACLADLGHDVVGAETNLAKVEAIQNGISVIKEPGLADLIKETSASGKLKAVNDGSSYVMWGDISLICVGTPSDANGDHVLDYLDNVARDIGNGLKESSSYHVVVLRSTVYPGIVRNYLLPRLEEYSGKTVGVDFGLVMNPEFLREASAIKDFYAPPYTVIGEFKPKDGEIAASLYSKIDAPIRHVKIEEAELLKLLNNNFHALKIGFANEVGRICDRLDINSHAIMGLVCEDRKLNISPAYLKPGFAFGGSCLPKDLRAMVSGAKRLGVQIPILEAILPSNRLQVEVTRAKIHALNVERIGILGLSFKPGTDDLRESPVIDLIRALWQDGKDIFVYDPDINPNEMLGSNREYLERQLPQIDKILYTSAEDVYNRSQAIIITQKREEFLHAIESFSNRVTIIDLVHLADNLELLNLANYQGLSW